MCCFSGVRNRGECFSSARTPNALPSGACGLPPVGGGTGHGTGVSPSRTEAPGLQPMAGPRRGSVGGGPAQRQERPAGRRGYSSREHSARPGQLRGDSHTKSTPATPPGFYRPADPRDPEAKSGEVHGEGLRWARGPQGTGGPGSWPDWKALTQNPPCHQPKTGFPDGLAFTSHFLPPPPRQGNVFIRGKSPR